MGIKCDMVFRHTGQGLGWVETWYLDQASIDTSAKSALRTAARQRITFLTPAAKIEYLRWSTNVPPRALPPNPRRQRNNEIELFDRVGSASAPIRESDPAWTAVKVRFNGTTSGVFAIREIRAMPAILFAGGAPNRPKDFMQKSIDDWVGVLQANGFKIRHKLRGAPPTDQFVDLREGVVLGITHRDTGRPLYLPRGRKAKRRV